MDDLAREHTRQRLALLEALVRAQERRQEVLDAVYRARIVAERDERRAALDAP